VLAVIDVVSGLILLGRVSEARGHRRGRKLYKAAIELAERQGNQLLIEKGEEALRASRSAASTTIVLKFFRLIGHSHYYSIRTGALLLTLLRTETVMLTLPAPASVSGTRTVTCDIQLRFFTRPTASHGKSNTCCC
jgi:hypothetical protein